MSQFNPPSNAAYKNLPSVDELLQTELAVGIAASAGQQHASVLVRQAVEELRHGMEGSSSHLREREDFFADALSRLEKIWRSEEISATSRVINATGVVIHTNLGRAPLSEKARRAVTDAAAGYCTVEYDVATGKRGGRGRRAEQLIAELTGAERVLIVNNCAAAAFFVLTVFAGGGEVVISRGELVEIGGDFRVPDVLTQSGATLVEVGTTNRTKLADYEKAISEKTKLFLRVHPSNYKIVGFTTSPTVEELASLSHKHDLVFYEDIGSGAIMDLVTVGLGDEPVVGASIAAGADIVTFSGDKLLGGPQAGIIAGRADLIDRLRQHPLFRTLRADKIVYAALEATLDSYRRGKAFDEIPVLRMMFLTKDQIAARVGQFTERVADNLSKDSKLKLEMLDGVSAVGGGAAPMARLETSLVSLSHKTTSASELSRRLRHAMVPVVARIENDRVIIDLRTVGESEEPELLEAILQLA